MAIARFSTTSIHLCEFIVQNAPDKIKKRQKPLFLDIRSVTLVIECWCRLGYNKAIRVGVKVPLIWRIMTEKPTFIQELEGLIESFPPNSILSRTIYQDDHIKTILFGFQPGQELSQHTAAVPAVLHFLKGKAQLLLGEERQQAQGGTWVHIPAYLPHSIQAESETLMLLTLVL
jgi:quercetin dioxygenase-like cupin family protein